MIFIVQSTYNNTMYKSLALKMDSFKGNSFEFFVKKIFIVLFTIVF